MGGGGVINRLYYFALTDYWVKKFEVDQINDQKEQSYVVKIKSETQEGSPPSTQYCGSPVVLIVCFLMFQYRK